MLLLHLKEKDCFLFDQLASGHSAIYTLSEENFFLAPTEPSMGSENQKIHCFEELQIKGNSRMSTTHQNRTSMRQQESNAILQVAHRDAHKEEITR
jgi:hypothetical protein